MNINIKKILLEQFNIGNMDLNGSKSKYRMNIFNKSYNHPYYYKVLDGTVTINEIKELNSLVGVATPKDDNELQKIIKFYSENYSHDSLNWVDVSGITNMTRLFENSNYNGDISQWDVSNVTNMKRMFSYSHFNDNISMWDVSNVITMCEMFYYSMFNGDISGWDVSNVQDMTSMFFNSPFNHDISTWNISRYTKISYMFAHSSYNHNMKKSKIAENLYYNSYVFHKCSINKKYIPKFIY